MLDAPTRDHIRWSIDAKHRRRLGAELDDDGQTDMQGTAKPATALATIAWEACGGDPLLALAYALDELGRRARAA